MFVLLRARSVRGAVVAEASPQQKPPPHSTSVSCDGDVQKHRAAAAVGRILIFARENRVVSANFYSWKFQYANARAFFNKNTIIADSMS